VRSTSRASPFAMVERSRIRARRLLISSRAPLHFSAQLVKRFELARLALGSSVLDRALGFRFFFLTPAQFRTWFEGFETRRARSPLRSLPGSSAALADIREFCRLHLRSARYFCGTKTAGTPISATIRERPTA